MLVLVLLVILVSMPFMEWVMMTNQKLVLPDFLKGLRTLDQKKRRDICKLLFFVKNGGDERTGH